jgi:hypothetical protein
MKKTGKKGNGVGVVFTWKILVSVEKMKANSKVEIITYSTMVIMNAYRNS